MEKVALWRQYIIIDDSITHLQFLNRLSQLINLFSLNFKGQRGRKMTEIKLLAN